MFTQGSDFHNEHAYKRVRLAIGVRYDAQVFSVAIQRNAVGQGSLSVLLGGHCR
jgi:hypothetical protein